MKVLLSASLAVFAYSMVVSSSTSQQFYPTGRLGQRWSEEKQVEWRDTREIQRSYQQEVVDKIMKLKDRYNVTQYGALSQDESRYPLFALYCQQERLEEQ